jgi:hypothetical protein
MTDDQIQNDHIWLKHLDLLEGQRQIVGGGDVIVLVVQHFPQQVEQVARVIDDKHMPACPLTNFRRSHGCIAREVIGTSSGHHADPSGLDERSGQVHSSPDYITVSQLAHRQGLRSS